MTCSASPEGCPPGHPRDEEVVVDRPVLLELVKEVPITVETPKEINVETRCQVEVIKEVPHQLVKGVPVPCQVTAPQKPLFLTQPACF